MVRLISMTLLSLLMNLPSFSQREGKVKPVTRVTLDREDIDLPELIKFFRLYRPDGVQYDSIFAGDPHFCIHLHNVPIDSLYHLFLDPLKIKYEDEGTLTLLRRDSVTVCELRVSDKSGFLSHASVHFRQPRDSATWITDDSGRLFFAVKPGPLFLQVSCIGNVTKEINFQRLPSNLAVTLDANFNDLDTLTLGGYGILTTLRDNTNSPTAVKLTRSEQESNDNIQEALKARVTGLAISDANGVPGGGQIIRIRGRNSIAQANSPLVVIDGIPVYILNPGGGNQAAPSAQGPAGFSPLNAFSVNMIGEAAILKDANSTALYGSRGGNGVFVLNTLVDTAGKEKWTLNFNTGASWIVPIQSPLSTRDFLALRRTAITNDSLPVDFNSLPEAYLWDSTRYTNYKKLLIGNPGWQLDLNGGFRKKDSTGYLVLNSWYHRESSVFFQQPVDSRAALSVHYLRHPTGHHYALLGSAIVTTDDQHLPASDYTNTITITPNSPAPYDSSGHLAFQSKQVSFANYQANALNTYGALNKSLFAHGQWTDTLKNFIVKVSGGYNGYWLKETISLPAAAQDPNINPYSITESNKTSYNTVVTEPMVEYNRRFSPKDSIDVLVGASWQQQITSTLYLTTEYGINAPVNANAGAAPTDNRIIYRYEAFFGRLHYNRNNRYTVDLSFRRDGSSRFGPGRQFGNFGAIGAGWTFSRTRLLKKNKILSFGKLRANYGTVGNDQIGDYQYMALWTPSGNQAGYRGSMAYTPATAFNPNLEWEVQHQFEGGMDLGLLHNRIFLYVSYYRHWSGNQLVLSSLSGQTSYQAVMANVPARVLNKGFELEGIFHLLSTQNWSWNVTGTLTIPENKLVSFPDLANSLYSSQLTIGKPLTELSGFVSTGVNPQSGLFTFLTKQGSKVVTSIGNTELHYYGGVSSSVSYKTITLDLFGEYRGQDGLSPFPQIYGKIPPGVGDPSGYSNQLIDPRWYWQKPGDHSLLQKPTATPGTAAWATIVSYLNSSAQITDASFIRLKTITLTCQLKEGFLKKYGCREGQFYVEAKNLFTLTHYLVTDPETQSPFSLPPLRTIRCGIRLKL